jgi:outer membrane protein insertion porin family
MHSLRHCLRTVLLACASVFVLSHFVFAQTDAAQTDDQKRSLKVLRIDVRGNQVINTGTILGNMKTRRGADLIQRVVNEDVKRLYATGFFQDIRIDVEESEEGIRLIVVVEEKPIVRTIVIEGSESFKERDLRKDLDVLEGQVLDEFVVKQGLNKIKERYASKGFRFVRVRYRIETDRISKEATIYVTVDEGAKYRVAEVRFEGNDSFSPRRLKKLMRTKARNIWLIRFGTFRDQKFQDDLDRITAFYQWNGFLDIRLTHDFEYNDEEGKIIVVLKVVEGNQYFTGSVDITGVKALQESEIWQRLKMLPGEIYSQQALSEEISAIRDFYFNYGYMGVQIRPEVNIHRDTGKVDVLYEIKEGDLFFVEQVKVRGNTKTKDIVIRRELRIRPGDKFDGTALEKSQTRLENLGFFEGVSYDTEPGTALNRKNVVFRVNEKRTGELSFGAGVSSIDQFIGFGEIAQKNFDLLNWPRFTGGGQSLALSGRWGTITRNFELNFVEPYLFNKPIAFGLDVFDLRRENRNVDFREERLGAGFTLSRGFTDAFRAGTGYKLERVDVFDVEDDAAEDVLLFEGERWLSRARIFVSYDKRDSIFIPTKGWIAGFSGELVGTFLGGEEDFYIFQANYSKFWSFFDKKHTLEWRVRLGFSDELGSEEVPIFDRFYAGGLGTVRGFNFRRVGPIEGGSAVGGTTMVLLNLDYTFPIPYVEQVKGVVFIDAGDVEADPYDVDIGNFRVSIGPGVKVNTPIGPVAIYYGYPIANPDDEDEHGRFEFSLSRSF